MNPSIVLGISIVSIRLILTNNQQAAPAERKKHYEVPASGSNGSKRPDR